MTQRITGAFLIVGLLLVAPVMAFAAGTVTVDTLGVSIVTVVIALVGAILGIFGVRNTSAGKLVDKIVKENTDVDAIDKAVEDMLTRVGIPIQLADYIGDIVAIVATNVDAYKGKSLLQIVIAVFTDEFVRRSAIEAANLAGNQIPANLLSNGTAREYAAKVIAITPQAQSIMVAKAAQKGLKLATSIA
jgi:hypothetical protein